METWHTKSRFTKKVDDAHERTPCASAKVCRCSVTRDVARRITHTVRNYLAAVRSSVEGRRSSDTTVPTIFWRRWQHLGGLVLPQWRRQANVHYTLEHHADGDQCVCADCHIAMGRLFYVPDNTTTEERQMGGTLAKSFSLIPRERKNRIKEHFFMPRRNRRRVSLSKITTSTSGLTKPAEKPLINIDPDAWC